MRNIVVSSASEVINYVDGKVHDLIGIVSVVDPDWPTAWWVSELQIPYLRENFYDIETMDGGPNVGHMERILKFVRDLPEKGTVLVHCAMGASRSPAVALVLLIQEGLDIDAACDRLDEVRPMTDPNRRIIGISDSLLNLGHDLEITVNKRYGKTTGLITPFSYKGKYK